jgi:hypothetical protein
MEGTMSGESTPSTKTFCVDLGTDADPIAFDAILHDSGGRICARVPVKEGHADLNAIHRGDGAAALRCCAASRAAGRAST